MAIGGISMEKMDWTGALKALNGIQGVKAVKEEGSISITRVGDGKPVTLTLSIPQLDDAEVFSTAELEKLVNNFDSLRADSPFPITATERQAFVDALNAAFSKALNDDPETVNDVFGTGPKRGASKSLFDVYAIFKLLITVAQLQRNALRDVRQAENAAVQKAILDQADEQRSAALAGLIGAVAVCTVQIGAQLGLMVGKAAAAKVMKALKATSGADAAETNLKTAKLAGDSNAAKANLDKLGKDLGVDEHGKSIKETIDKKFESCPEFDKLKADKTKLTNEKASLTEKLGDARKGKAELEKDPEWNSLYQRCLDANAAIGENLKKAQSAVRRRIMPARAADSKISK